MKVYKSGTVVIANYVNFKGEKKQGVFMILYDEALDNTTDSVMNLTAIKITTQLSMVGNYAVNLKNEDSDFFKHDSLASCSKIHTIHCSQRNDIPRHILLNGKCHYSGCGDNSRPCYGIFRSAPYCGGSRCSGDCAYCRAVYLNSENVVPGGKLLLIDLIHLMIDRLNLRNKLVIFIGNKGRYLCNGNIYPR